MLPHQKLPLEAGAGVAKASLVTSTKEHDNALEARAKDNATQGAAKDMHDMVRSGPFRALLERDEREKCTSKPKRIRS